jgi:carbonic anhydrase
MGKLSGLLEKIDPAVRQEKSTINNRNSKNATFINNVAAINVELVANQIIKQSEILSNMVKNKQIAIAGGMYDVTTGIVNFNE